MLNINSQNRTMLFITMKNTRGFNQKSRSSIVQQYVPDSSQEIDKWYSILLREAISTIAGLMQIKYRSVRQFIKSCQTFKKLPQWSIAGRDENIEIFHIHEKIFFTDQALSAASEKCSCRVGESDERVGERGQDGESRGWCHRSWGGERGRRMRGGETEEVRRALVMVVSVAATLDR